MSGTAPRAFLRVGGVSVARQQLTLALALQAERVICLAGGVTPALVDLQHQAEEAGASFHVIGNARALLGLITATDEVIALGDGLFASAPLVAGLLGQGQCVLVQPIEQGLAAGFERIDLNHAAAAAMRVPGRLVERIAELPADCDAISALQRIALQAGVPQRAIPPLGPDSGFWTLIRSEDDAHALEPAWIRQRTVDGDGFNLSRALARAAVHSFGPSLLHAGSGAGSIVIAAVTLAVLGLGVGWFALVPLGLVLCALGWILRESAVMLARIQSDQPNRGMVGVARRAAYAWLIDGIMVTLLAWQASPVTGPPEAKRFFAPLMLFALLRILPRAVSHRWTTWLKDRAVIALGLAGAVIAGVGSEAVHGAALGLAALGVVASSLQARITAP